MPPLLVEPLRVDDAAGRDRDVVGRDALQHGLGIGALDAELAERAHVEQADAARAPRRCSAAECANQFCRPQL